MQHLETCLLIAEAGRQRFVLSCDVFNCLFSLDVQNEIQLLSRFFFLGVFGLEKRRASARNNMTYNKYQVCWNFKKVLRYFLTADTPENVPKNIHLVMIFPLKRKD